MKNYPVPEPVTLTDGLVFNVKLTPGHTVTVTTRDGEVWQMNEARWLYQDMGTLLVYNRYTGSRPKRFDVKDITKLKCYFVGE